MHDMQRIVIVQFNNKAVALGETVKVGENFGIRITQIGDVKQVIRSMGTIS